MKTYTITHSVYKQIADLLTPVSIYLNIRDKFPKSILLESSDYHGNENSYSFICFRPVAGFSVAQGLFKAQYPDNTQEEITLKSKVDLPNAIQAFCKKFLHKGNVPPVLKAGLFGYTTYDCVQYFEDIVFKNTNQHEIPDMQYFMYEYVIAINHFNDEMYVVHFSYEGDPTPPFPMEQVIDLLHKTTFPTFKFQLKGDEASNYTDSEFLDIVAKGKEHCFRGDVFQIVLSRRFSQHYEGDEFNVYRALRSINPSPYLFYFDYGGFRIFGSSPEAQLIIKDDTSVINPIAGTFRRTGNDVQDAILAQKLLDDPKESSEHVMLVDLARNDLSRSGDYVHVATFKEVQYYSHVIHLVSKVVGKIASETNKFQIVADTFPAGTLSGAPKYMAMQLIDKYENINRGFYGGCIGYLDFEGNFNQAIMIRSFLAKDNTLICQAGAGVVADSIAENELQEVNNKLAALKQAAIIASNM